MFNETHKIVIFGEAGTGKTTLMHRYITNRFSEDIKITIGLDFHVKTLSIEEKKVKLQIWDFGGEERFRFLFPSYMLGASGGIFMYDITNYSTLVHIDDWLSLVKNVLEEMNKPRIPLLVIGGKADLSSVREVPFKEGEQVAKSREAQGFMECSSKSGDNVERVFETLARLILEENSSDHEF